MDSGRMERIDELIDDAGLGAGWASIAAMAPLVAFVVAVRVFGGAS